MPIAPISSFSLSIGTAIWSERPPAGPKGVCFLPACVDGGMDLFGSQQPSEGNGRAGPNGLSSNCARARAGGTDHRPRDERVVAIPVEQAELGPHRSAGRSPTSP